MTQLAPAFTFLRACRNEPITETPIWIMRQAGRYLPEYRAVREKHSFLDVCRVPELCAEVTAQPIDRYGFDAAILFSDILIPVIGLGVPVAFNPGPVLEFHIEVPRQGNHQPDGQLRRGAARTARIAHRHAPILGGR